MINWKTSKPRRAGIILYNSKYCFAGIDKRSGDITDFGGKVIYNIEDALEGAMREFKEETLFMFPDINWLDLYNGDVIVNDDIVIFLLEVDYDVNEYIKKFNEKRDRVLYSEIEEIVSIDRKKKEYGKVYSLIEPLFLLIFTE